MVRRWTLAALVTALGLAGFDAAMAQESPYNHVPLNQFFAKPKKPSLFKRFLTKLSIGLEDEKKAEATLPDKQLKNPPVNALPGQSAGTYKARLGK